MQKNKPLFYVLAVISSCCILGIVAAIAINSSDPIAASNSSASNPDQQTKTIIKDALREGNRDVERLSSMAWSEGDKTLTVKWAINDNLGEDLIKSSARSDIKNMLQAIAQKGIPYEYQTIVFDGSFSLQDVYGKASEERVVLASYSRATINKINWDNFLKENMYTIADSIWLHPTFQ